MGESPRKALHRRVLDRLLPSGMRGLEKSVRRLEDRIMWLEGHVTLVREAVGRIERRQIEGATPATLHDAEFRVFSQHGEDGAIAEILRRVDWRSESFVEIGVESYEEANTRFLLTTRNWRGLLVEADAAQADHIRRSPWFWRHDLTVLQEWVTPENVDALVRDAGFGGELGLLSIDVDGVDWWLWNALECARPAVVIIEYNWRFGADAAVTVPCDPTFDRRRAHHSLCYYGASLEALCRLGRRKGYVLVGCESHGVNALFVRADLPRRDLPERTAQECFVAGRYREAHDAEGARRFEGPGAEPAILADLPVVEIGPDGIPRG